MIVDVRDFNLICGLAESSESGFSTTYCGYPKFVEIRREICYIFTFHNVLIMYWRTCRRLKMP